MILTPDVKGLIVRAFTHKVSLGNFHFLLKKL